MSPMRRSPLRRAWNATAARTRDFNAAGGNNSKERELPSCVSTPTLCDATIKTWPTAARALAGATDRREPCPPLLRDAR